MVVVSRAQNLSFEPDSRTACLNFVQIRQKVLMCAGDFYDLKSIFNFIIIY